MNWFKAKNLILISLLALNVILLIMIFLTSHSYTLTNQQIENMYQVLSSKYNIGIYSELPRKYEPLRELEVINFDEDSSEVLYNTFFDENEEVARLTDADKIIFQSDDKTLMTQAGDFAFSSISGIEIPMSQILKELQDDIGEFYLYDKYVIDDTTYYDYRQIYKNQVIYTNYFIFEVKDDKIYKVEGYNAKPKGFIGDKKEIVSVDMVLFNFANFYPRGENEQLIVDSVQLVYNQEQIISEPNVSLKATPCYLIKVRGNVVPVKVDAYTNTILTR